MTERSIGSGTASGAGRSDGWMFNIGEIGQERS